MVLFDILLIIGLALMVGIVVGLIFSGFYSQWVNMKAKKAYAKMIKEREIKLLKEKSFVQFPELPQNKFRFWKPWTWFNSKKHDKGGLNNGKQEIKRTINGRIDEGERESPKSNAIGSIEGRQNIQISSNKKSSRYKRQFKQDWPNFS